jgi:hypothetical protein
MEAPNAQKSKKVAVIMKAGNLNKIAHHFEIVGKCHLLLKCDSKTRCCSQRQYAYISGMLHLSVLRSAHPMSSSTGQNTTYKAILSFASTSTPSW